MDITRAGIFSCTMKKNVFSGTEIRKCNKRKCAFGRSLNKDANLSPFSVSCERAGVWEKPAAGTVEVRPDHWLRLATYSSTKKHEAVRENRVYLPTRSNAAVTAGVIALEPNCAMGFIIQLIISLQN